MREIHDGAKHSPLAGNAGADSLPMDDAAVADCTAENGCVEERLRKQEAFYRNIIEGAADVTTLLTPDGTIVYASASIAEPTSLGYPPELVIGHKCWEIIHPDDRQGVVDAIANDLAGRPTTVEARAMKSDGSWMWTEMRGKAIVGLDGTKFIVAYSRDITDRKLLEERLMRGEEYYKSLLRGSSDLVTVIDESGTLVFASDSVEKTLGYRLDEVIGQPIFSYFHPGDLALATKRFTEVSESNSSLTELRVRRKDGTWCSCEGTGRAVTSPDGRRLVLIITRDISERRRLDREHALLAAIVESSDDAIVSNSLDQRIMTWNKGAERMFGYTAAEAIGQTASLYMPPEWKNWGEKFLDELKTRIDSARSLEVPCMRKDGSQFEAWTVLCGIRDRHGKLIGISAIHRDLSARKHAEREQGVLAAIANASTDAIIGYSKDLLITNWNPAAEHLYGYSAAEAIGRGFDLFVPADQLPLALEADRRVLETGVPVTFEQITQRKDGSPFISLVNIFPIRDLEGNIVGGAGIGRDITELKHAQHETAVLAAIVNASQDAIINVSPEGTVISWNQGAEKLYGYTSAEAIGKGIELFVPPEELADTAARTMRVAETGQPASWEQRPRNKDGREFVFAVSIFPILDATGKVISVAGIGRDITALKETERELVTAREAALAASQAKSEFLSSMSHEIRTPMTAILGMAELLAEGELNAEQRRYIDILGNNGHALLDLINSILDLAKVESGRLTLERVGFDLREVVEKSAQTLAIRAHAKGLELTVSIARDVPTALLGDPLRLRQVLINLIGNAIKFTEHGEVLVAVERDYAPDEPIRLKFGVRDTGIGIAKDKVPALFAAFSQADSSTARKYGGSGLGLAIVKRLVNLMQGEVSLESEPGMGSVFSFTALFELDPDAPAAEPWPDLAKVPMLIVDNKPTGRAVLGQMLAEHGAAVVEAASYEEGRNAIARAVATGRPPRVVLLDDRTAAADADGIAQLIAAASQCGASIVATIHCDNLAADISRLKSLKLEAYLIKPIDMRELAKVISAAMAGETGEAPQSHPAAHNIQPPQVVERALKILFADDSTDNRTLIRAFLKKTPYHLDEVENGRQAIDRFVAAGDYDLVLMDIQMPVVDGYAATRAIRDWEREHNRARTPIIALTASVFNEAVRLTRAAGCDAHLGKPIGKATLLRAIYEAVGGA